MPKRGREEEEEQLEEVAKRVCLIDNIPDENPRKRSFEHDHNAPSAKRMRLVEPTTIKYKAHEYRDCIRKLYNMNKRLLHKLEIEKMHTREAEEKFLHLKNEVKMRGIMAHAWPTFTSSPPPAPVVY